MRSERLHRAYHAAAVVVALAVTYLMAVPQTRASHLAVSATFFATALVAWAFVERRTFYTEYFAPALRVCTGDTCPEPVQELPDEVDAYTAALMPLRPCDMYFTDNINECDADMYKKSKLELIDLRTKYEAAPEMYATQLAEVNRVLADYDTVYQRQCKLTFNDWMRPDDPSYPLLRVNAAEAAARGNPRHWAFCFAPVENAAAENNLNKLIDKNTAANGETLYVTEGDEYALLTGTNRRVEFGSVAKRDLVKAFCTIFSPMLMPALKPFYLNLARKNLLYAVDMTNDGILRDILMVRWVDGYLRVIPKNAMVDVETYQDDVAQRPNYMGMPQTPERFSLETAYHCGPPRLVIRQSVYTENLKKLFINEVVNGNLVYTLMQQAQMFVFNINICQRVDKIDTKNIVNLMAFFGNAIPGSSMLRAGESQLYDELLEAKDQAHKAVCDLATSMTKTYNDLMDIRRQQKALANSYIGYSQPDTGAQVRMEPQTNTTEASFLDLRSKETALETKFKQQTKEKMAQIATVDRLNMAIASVEDRMRTTITTLQTAIKGKRIAVHEKPYTYISNDGRVYFQMME